MSTEYTRQHSLKCKGLAEKDHQIALAKMDTDRLQLKVKTETALKEAASQEAAEGRKVAKRQHKKKRLVGENRELKRAVDAALSHAHSSLTRLTTGCAAAAGEDDFAESMLVLTTNTRPVVVLDIDETLFHTTLEGKK